MSEVVQSTAVVPPLDEAGARKLTDRIRLLLGPFLDQRDKLLRMVTEAREGDAHLALGYRSWSEYISTEFAGLLPRLASDDRRALVGELAAAGMSTRAIAPVVGASVGTVHADREVFRNEQVAPESRPVANRGDDQDVMHGASPAREITGRDGKTYSAGPGPEPTSSVEPRKERRRSLPDQYRETVRELQKAAENLERLHTDDRFAANREALNERHWRTVSNLAALMSSIEGDLSGSSNCSFCGGRVLPNSEFLSKCGDCQ